MHCMVYFIIQSITHSYWLVTADSMMRGCSNTVVIPRSINWESQNACSLSSNILKRISRTTHSRRYHGGWNNRSQMTFITSLTHRSNITPLFFSRTKYSNIVSPLPVHGSATDISQEDYNHSATPRFDGNFKQRINSSVITQGLNLSQKEATLRPRYSITRVIAGPGAGKTKVLTCRIAHLMMSSENSKHDFTNEYPGPREGVLAVTFTKKAAMEMERRLTDLLSSSTVVENEQFDSESSDEAIVINGDVDPTDSRNTSDIARQLMRQTTVGTFHSVCSKILRKFGDELGNLPSVRECVDSSAIKSIQNREDNQGDEPTPRVQLQTLDGSFNILDQSDQLRILKDILNEHNIELKSNDAMSKGGRSDDIRPITILNAISLLNTEDAVLRIPQKNARKETIEKEISNKMSRKVRQIATEIRVPFQRAKYVQNSVDFDDLIFLTRELLLVNPAVREVLHRRWRHILVE